MDAESNYIEYSDISDSNESARVLTINHNHKSLMDKECNVYSEMSDSNESRLQAIKQPISKKKYTQKVRDDWFKNEKYRNWIVRLENNKNKLFCKYCKISLFAKKYIMDRHANTKTHIEAAKPFSDLRQSTISYHKDKQNRSVNNDLEIYICMYVACHQSILPTGHLCDVINAKCHLKSEIKLRRTKCTGIIQNILGEHFRNDLKNDIGNSTFSILIDESNDISVTKYLGMAIMYFSKIHGKIISTYLELCELSSCDAQSIVYAIKDVLRKFNLNLKNLLGLGTDNASVMTGINNGVHAILKREVPSLVLIRCACHSIVLAVQHATKCLPTELEFMLRETHNWFAHSSIRMFKYKELFRLINENATPLNIPRISDTRWLSIEKAIKTILSSWLELSTMFNIEKSECKTADILSKMFSNKTYKVYFIFLAPILKEVASVNLAFQLKTADPSKLLNDLVNLLKSLASKIVYNHTFDVIQMNITDFIDWNSLLGYYFENEIKTISMEEQRIVRRNCITFIQNLVIELKNRLPDNILRLKQMYVLSIDKVLRKHKESILPILTSFESDPALITEIEFQYKKMDTIQWQSTTTIELWLEVAKYRDAAGENPFADISKFALKLLALPHSNGDIERVFSQMNLIKNKTRNRMQFDTLNAILNIRFGLQRYGQCCNNYILPSDVIQKVGTCAAYNKDEEELPIAELLYNLD